MGFGQIIGGGADGRYTVRIDHGDAQKTTALAQLATLAVQLDEKIAAAFQALTIAEAKTADQRALVTTAVNQYIAAVQASIVSGSVPPQDAHNSARVQDELRAFDAYRRDLARLASADAGARLTYEALKFDRARVASETARWAALDLIEEKQAWCVDLTEDASGFVATIDVNGESSHTLIAAGGRAWSPGDGTVSAEDKAAAIQTLTGRHGRLTAARATAESRRVASIAAEATLKSALESAQAAYNANPTAETSAAVSRASESASAQRQATFSISARIASMDVELSDLSMRIAEWDARPASATPNRGDGLMTARDVQSPAQVFWNAAALPGVQKWRPTYRWGTISALNFDNDTASVDLAPATSSAQGLGINVQTGLANVPVAYMECNAKAFEVGDRCIVKFNGQDWGSPTVIGFVDNPQPCLLESAVYRAVGLPGLNGGELTIINVQEKAVGDDWESVTAPNPSQTSNTHWAYWNDGVQTRTRSDGEVTESIVKTAQYVFVPPLRVFFSWYLVAEPTSEPYFSGPSSIWVRDWKVTANIIREPSGITGIPLTFQDPEPFDRTYTAWEGRALGGLSGTDVMLALLEPEGLPEQWTDPIGPLFFAEGDLVSTSSQPFAYTVWSSAPVHHTVANSSDPAIPLRIPSDGAGGSEAAGGFREINYTSQSWTLTWE